jgi:5-methylcytosine-specific restriction endonuclease McrA
MEVGYEREYLYLSSSKQPLMPTSPVRARKLLDSGKAAVLRMFPFTIILKNREPQEKFSLSGRNSIPEVKETGIAVVNETTKKVVFAAVLVHRGQTIKKRLDSRRVIRRGRRNRNTRYRAPRFNNRTRPKGWLPPSLQHRVATIMTWVGRLLVSLRSRHYRRNWYVSIFRRSRNRKFPVLIWPDTKLVNISCRNGVTLMVTRGAQNVPLEVEHIHPKAKGGTNRVSNLCIAFNPCNTKKGCSRYCSILEGQT